MRESKGQIPNPANSKITNFYSIFFTRKICNFAGVERRENFYPCKYLAWQHIHCCVSGFLSFRFSGEGKTYLLSGMPCVIGLRGLTMCMAFSVAFVSINLFSSFALFTTLRFIFWFGMIYFYHSIRCNRTAFKIANNATPTSANTAAHIVAKPLAPNISTIIFTPNAKVIFCQITL